MDVPASGTTTGRILALGEPVRLSGYALAGVTVAGAAEPAEVRRAWADLPTDVALVVLTPDAAAALGVRRSAAGAPLTVVIPP